MHGARQLNIGYGHLAIAIGIAATGSILLQSHGLTRGLGYGIVGVLVLLTCRYAAVGLVSVFPLLFALDPAPVRPGIAEFLFAALVATTCLRSVVDHREQAVDLLRRTRWISLAVVGFLLCNWIVADRNEVSAVDWLRGAVPFVFLLFWVPVYLVLRSKPAITRVFMASVLLTALLFCGKLIALYLSQRLWQPHPHVFLNGDWVRLTLDEASTMPKEQVHEFVQRITMIMPSATDVLIPLGIVWGVLLAAGSNRPAVRAGGTLSALLCTMAVTFTYTRSAILSVLVILVGIALAFCAIDRSRIPAILAVYMALGSTSLATIFAFGLQDIYFNRMLQLQAVARVFEQSPHIAQLPPQEPIVGVDQALLPAQTAPQQKPTAALKDANIDTRVLEYRIALDIFRASPLLGAGLGARHEIRFDQGMGDSLRQHVSYVHNWPFYMLKTGGLFGFALYTALLLGIVTMTVRGNHLEANCKTLLIATVAFLSVYALFFASFRLIGFNLLLAAALGIAMTGRITANVPSTV